MVKMNNKMIVLCSAALGSIYLTGFSLTDHPIQTASAATPLQKGIVTGHPVQLQSPTQSPKTSGSQSTKSVAGSGSAKVSSHTKSVQPKPVQSTHVQPKRVQPVTTHKAVQQKVTKPSAPQNKVYKDGTFTGEASNSIGGVQVAVTTKADKIVSVKITNCTTSYSESNITGLPQQVVSKQSANVDLVSGATLMSEDFQGAVQQALQQAKL